MTRPFSVDARVESLTHTGEAVVRLESGQVVLVGGLLPGELARLRVVPQKAKLAAEFGELLERSPDRVEPPCPAYPRCGGCDFMHASRSFQATHHADQVLSALSHAASPYGLLVPAPMMHAEAPAERSRTRARLHFQVRGKRVELGFFAGSSRDIVPIDDCLVLEARLFDAAKQITSALIGGGGRASGTVQVGYGKDRKPVVELTTSEDPSTGAVTRFVELCKAGGELSGIRVTVPGGTLLVYGDPRPRQVGPDEQELVLAAGGFAQASDQGASLLASRVRDLAEPKGKKVLELFSGSGTLSVLLAVGAASFSSIESHAESVQCARKNLDARSLKGKLRVDDAEAVALQKADVVVLDPPRAGAPKSSAALAKLRVARIVYVSCDPSTLARDARVFFAAGYRVTGLEVLDLFPHTRHVEAIARFERIPR